MRRRLLGLVVVAALAACSDSTPTGTRPSRPDLSIRSEVVDPVGTLDANILIIIGFWNDGHEKDLLHKWADIKKKYEEGQIKPKKLEEAIKKLFEMSKHALKEAKHMDDPPTGESPEAAVARLILYMNLYVFGGPGTDPPSFDPEADNAVGFLTPNKELTLITPGGNAGVHFDKGSVDENRVIVITENPTEYGECDGPLLTELCQYPLFYDIESFPAGALLKTAQAAVCHPEVGDPRGPDDEDIHDQLRLAHPIPSNPADYVFGGTIRNTPSSEEDIEILPLISQAFLPACENIDYGTEYVGEGLLQRGVRFASAIASRIGRLLSPRSAYAIDQGGGGGFDDFGSPFNNVDPLSDIPYPD